MKLIASTVAALAAVSLVAGCSGSDTSTKSQTTSATPPAHLTVFAASSLKKTFTELGTQFEKDHPGSKVDFSFAGSSDLVSQLTNGAPADVFASADTKNMDKVKAASLLVGEPTNFAKNTLVIVTAPGNPKNITSFADLANPDLLVVECAPQVPCGSAAQKVETATGVDVKPVSEEQNVSDVLNKVTTGQADAGLVYVTDAKGAGDKVFTVEFPEAKDAVNTYPICLLTNSKNKEAADEFIELVTGPVGQDVLAKAGFAKP
ncbi:molybdate ABC transporter substrate-binding protein [Smaragdicoccus niigatensis]|uniref:molybdate ABC transporter substrate-binding protein n=1 Tax=Smaragdicoccus niigatensis TaxID=359359 RepID=UPI00035D0A87